MFWSFFMYDFMAHETPTRACIEIVEVTPQCELRDRPRPKTWWGRAKRRIDLLNVV
jgi:hypothetical protein